MKPAENYILEQPEPFKSILLHLQLLIESSFADVVLKYKYKIPFYYLNDKPFCYLNSVVKKGYVDVGFWASAHLKYNEHLLSDGRKVVKSLRYQSVKEIDESILLSVLEEACQVNYKGFWLK